MPDKNDTSIPRGIDEAHDWALTEKLATWERLERHVTQSITLSIVVAGAYAALGSSLDLAHPGWPRALSVVIGLLLMIGTALLCSAIFHLSRVYMLTPESNTPNTGEIKSAFLSGANFELELWKQRYEENPKRSHTANSIRNMERAVDDAGYASLAGLFEEARYKASIKVERTLGSMTVDVNRAKNALVWAIGILLMCGATNVVLKGMTPEHQEPPSHEDGM